MTNKTKPIFKPTLLSTSESVLYEVGVNTTTLLKNIILHNTSTTPAVVTISIPEKGDVSSKTNEFTVIRIAGKESLKVPEAFDHVIEEGDSIRAFADVDGAVNIRAGGIEIV